MGMAGVSKESEETERDGEREREREREKESRSRTSEQNFVPFSRRFSIPLYSVPLATHPSLILSSERLWMIKLARSIYILVRHPYSQGIGREKKIIGVGWNWLVKN
jgi:hypothetical protein